MRFAKLPDAGLMTLRQVLDDDEHFRKRVAASLTEARTDRPSWLWLSRPPGWESELGDLREVARVAAREAHETRAERSARRKLEAVEAARARSAEAAETARRVAAERLAELARERQGRRVAEERGVVLAAELRQARTEAALSRKDADAADDRAHRADAMVARATSDLATAEEERKHLLSEVARLSQELATAKAEEGRVRVESDELRRRITAGVLDAAHATAALQGALDRTMQEVGGDRGLQSVSPGGRQDRAIGHDSPAHTDLLNRGAANDHGDRSDSAAGGAVSQRAVGLRSGRPSPRRPAPIPGGLFADSIEVAAHLVRLPNAELLVDGYNVSLNTWAGLALPEQRHRLTSALGELAARSGLSVHVVFDASADEWLPPPVGVARRPVRVSFSAVGEDADEVLIALVERSDPDRPVLVATDDRRLRMRAEARGANVLSVGQLLAVLGRRPRLG